MTKLLGMTTLALVALTTVAPARADFMVYTSRSSFEAALSPGSFLTENFNELPSGIQMYPNGLAQPTLTQPLRITGTNGFLTSGSANDYGLYPNNGTYLVGPVTNSATDGITVMLPSLASTAGGGDVTIFGNVAGTVSFFGTTSQNESFSGTIPVNGTNPTFGFLGIRTTSANDYLTSLTFSASLGTSTNIVLDNFTFNNTSVPEPASLALMATGVVAFAGYAARRRLQG